jgi:deoxyribonuclease V
VGLYITRCEAEKSARLQQDGVAVVQGRVDLERFRFDSFRSTIPLAALCELQARIPEQLRLEPLAHTPQRVGGVDVSYLSRTEAVAAFVLLALPSLELLWTKTLQGGVTFPYISGYLSFRELPLLATLFDEVRAAGCEPDVTFVDGNGLLHPRRAGIASCFGLAAGTPTIGVGKKLLCGRIDDGSRTAVDSQAVEHEGETVGYAVRASPKNRPFYVSPGHMTDLAAALAVTRMTLGPHRLPLPIAFADRESRRETQRLAEQPGTTTRESHMRAV